MNPEFARFIDEKTEVSRKELCEQLEAVRYQDAGFHLSEDFVVRRAGAVILSSAGKPQELWPRAF